MFHIPRFLANFFDGRLRRGFVVGLFVGCFWFVSSVFWLWCFLYCFGFGVCTPATFTMSRLQTLTAFLGCATCDLTTDTVWMAKSATERKKRTEPDHSKPLPGIDLDIYNRAEPSQSITWIHWSLHQHSLDPHGVKLSETLTLKCEC